MGCGLDFGQERSHSTGPGGFERACIKAGASGTKEELSIEGTTGASLGGALLRLPRNVAGKE